MHITPKKTKYHYTFRNKLQNKKIMQADMQARSAFGKKRAQLNQIFKINAWSQAYSAALKEGVAVAAKKGATGAILPKKSFVNHASSQQLLFGAYGIIFETHGKLSAKFIKTLHLDIAKTLKKKSKVWLRLCCDTPVTARPVETRMGKGKGAICYWEAKVSPGQVLFEFSGITKTGVMGILKNMQQKSPLRLRLVAAY